MNELCQKLLVLRSHCLSGIALSIYTYLQKECQDMATSNVTIVYYYFVILVQFSVE